MLCFSFEKPQLDDACPDIIFQALSTDHSNLSENRTHFSQSPKKKKEQEEES